MSEGEVPWFTTPPEAWLAWSEQDVLGHLWFLDPNGERAIVPVTKGQTQGPPEQSFNIWHIEIEGNLATVSPSIHYIGKWHSPNPVQFVLVDKKPW